MSRARVVAIREELLRCRPVAAGPRRARLHDQERRRPHHPSRGPGEVVKSRRAGSLAPRPTPRRPWRPAAASTSPTRTASWLSSAPERTRGAGRQRPRRGALRDAGPSSEGHIYVRGQKSRLQFRRKVSAAHRRSYRTPRSITEIFGPLHYGASLQDQSGRRYVLPALIRQEVGPPHDWRGECRSMAVSAPSDRGTVRPRSIEPR